MIANMATNPDVGKTEELNPQSASSTDESDRPVDPKMSCIENNVVVEESSSAADGMEECNPPDSNLSVPKEVKPKLDVGFKLPQLPVIGKFPSKFPRPKQGPGSSGSKVESRPADSHQQKDLDVANSGQNATDSKSVKPRESNGVSTKKNEDSKDDKVVSEPDTKSEAEQRRTEIDSFMTPELPSKQPLKQTQSKPKVPHNVSSLREEEKKQAETVSPDGEETESLLLSSEKVSSPSSGGQSSATEKGPPKSKLSPAEKLARAAPLPYKEPPWSGVPRKPYHLEVLKGGKILSNIPLNEKAFVVFGRLESCDVMLEHPSLSRYHMVLQYRLVGDSDNDPGFYVFDLDSTHGSFLNKQKLKPKIYCRMQVGHMFKLAGSTRLYILQGPADDEEAESELSVTELKQMREKQLIELEKQRMQEKEEEEEKERQDEEAKGISWGMDADDAEEEDPSEVNPFAAMTKEEREELYIKDPKKTLRGFFEREGFELEYDVEEKNTGHGRQYICRIQLPVDDAGGNPITAEAIVSGKKKEAVIACALEACRILDAQGVLRQAKHESKKKKAKNWADDDYYDSDDDTFLDRTGEIEKKREARMKKAGVIKEEVETFASLTAKLAQVESEMKQIDEDIETLKQTIEQSAGDDSLEAFMSSIKSGTAMDKTRRAKLKIRRIELRKDQAKLMKLINIARPAALPAIKRQSSSSLDASSGSSTAPKKQLPMIGSLKGRLGAKKFKFVMPVAANPVVQSAISSTTEDVEEEEEDDDDEVAMETSKDASGDGDHVSSSADDDGKQRPKEDVPSKQDVRPAKGPTLPPSQSKKGPMLPPSRSIKGPSRPSSSRFVKGPTLPPVIKGPTLPPDLDMDEPQRGVSKREYEDEEEEEEEVPEKKKPAKKVAMETEEDVADWVPPQGQTGDGRTSLNEKFGY